MAISISDEWKKRVPNIFPALLEGANFDFTSNVDYNYNCLAWALSYDSKYFENSKGSYWPWKDCADDTVEGWSGVCQLHGFSLTDGAEFEKGFERIAIFEDEEGVSHACRTGSDGIWKSKLGTGPDIEHADLVSLEEGYGKVVVILKRHRPDW